jgi:hypothetical protein
MRELPRIHARAAKAASLMALFTGLVLLAGCQQLFTYSPVTFLQTPASRMTPDQQLTFGQDALASGDTARMADAFTVLTTQTSSGDAQLLAGKLGAELSGVPAFILDLSAGVEPMPVDGSALLAAIQGRGLTLEYLAQAGANVANAEALGTALSPEDYILGSIGLAMQAAYDKNGSYTDSTGLAPADIAAAVALADAGVTSVSSLPPTSPLVSLMSQFQTYISGL